LECALIKKGRGAIFPSNFVASVGIRSFNAHACGRDGGRSSARDIGGHDAFYERNISVTKAMASTHDQRWSRNYTSVDSEDTITSRFERHVATTPDELAIVTDEVSLTYRALDIKSNRIAAALTSLSSQRERPIAILVRDEAIRISAMLGTLKANRIFIPLAPDSPPQWITQVIEDSGTAHIIVDSSTRSIAEFGATGDVIVVEVEQLNRSLQLFVADRTTSPEGTAYIVYTSGSTGRAKGVANSHRRLIRTTDTRCTVFGLARCDRFGNLSSSAVGTGISHAFLPLLLGRCLFPFDIHRHGLQKLTSWLIAQRISYVSFVGPLLRSWLGSLPDNLRFPALRIVGVGGDPLYAQDAIQLARHLEGDWHIGHSYASTETGIMTAQVLTSSSLPDAGIVAVGHPVDEMEVSVQNEMGEPVSLGEIGEIVVRSRFLAQGYWNNPDLTVKVFQDDPLDRAVRVYRTGDLGRWRNDGMLEHMGRKGRRIRLRGYNVEPFQVECELMRHPGVTDAVVLLNDGAAGQEPCLVGYVVAPSNTSPSAIRKGLAERLPSYMVPSYIAVLDSFPIAGSGKIDYNALPPPYREKRQTALPTPSDDREHQLLEIWQEVLKIPKIGIDDDFFELGGTSLQALMVFARIEALMGSSLSPTTIVQAPTIARLAEFIRATTDIATSQSLVPFRTSGKGLPLFLVHSLYCYVVSYRHLVSNLKSDRPVFGLQPPPLDGKHHIPHTIERMALDYVYEIRRVQPRGPYSIAGHSFGGLVSFEIAQQLVREGERVDFLGLIDPLLRNAPLNAQEPRKSEPLHPFRQVYSFIRKLRFIRSSGPKHWQHLSLRFGRSIPYEHRPDYLWWFYKRASRAYVPKPYPGHITMFSSAGNSERQRAHWGPLAHGGLTVLEEPADHRYMIMPPHSKLLAEHFDACLDAAARRESNLCMIES
jgi:amino acid adenylation domain-containing protein